MKTKLNIWMVLALMAALVGGNTGVAQASIPLGGYASQGSVNIAPATATLTAVDPLVYVEGTDVVPARPFLYSVNSTGITITRFNDNAVVSQYPVTDADGVPTGDILGTWPWPDELWITLPDGGQMAIPKPEGGWEPVSMTVSAPTDAEMANRAKDIPDLTPPFTFVYVVMAHSGYEWASSNGVRDMIVPSTSLDTESAVLVQIDVSDPSFSTSIDPAAPTEPHIAGAILGHEAGQPVYDRKTGSVYVGNQEFVSVIARIPDTVAAEEREIPGIGQPVIRCGPQHPETGIPVGRPQAYACYDPGAKHPINDNEHVGGYGQVKEWDTEPGGEGGGLGALAVTPFDEQFVWEFRNLPDWLKPHLDLVSGQYDGILYGTPPTTGEWIAEARVHNLADEYGVFSDWHPIFLSVRPTAEYLPVKVQFAAGVPVSWPLEGTGSCALTGAPAWVDVQTVPNGCVVMGRAPTSGEYYNFSMPGFRETGYPNIPIVFSGIVVGGYSFVPLPAGVGISGMAWHQVEKYADPSTETPVLSGEFIGVDPSSGQLYQILQAPGQPQPPNERPAETALTIDVVNAEGTALAGSGFGEVAVEADRDIYVAADNAVIKVSGGTATPISLPEGMQVSSLSLDSDLRTAILGVEPGQVDHGVLWAAGAGKVAVIDTDLASVAQSFNVPGASYVSADFGAQWAYAATGSSNLAIFGPSGSKRPPMEPRIWSSEELNFNQTYPGKFRVMATGDPLPSLSMLSELDLPLGLTYHDNGDGFAWVSGTPADTAGGDGYAYAITAQNSAGIYAQAFGITVYGPAEFTTANTATFAAGSASSFTVSATAPTAPILYTWDEEPVMAPGVELVDHEDGTAGLQGTPTTPGTYTVTIGANTGFLTDDKDTTQLFTLNVEPEGTAIKPVITSFNTLTWEVIGAPFSPDQLTVTSIGSPTPKLSVEGTLPPGVTFIDNGDSTGALGADCQVAWPGMQPECLGLLSADAEGTWTFTIKATNDGGVTYAIQPFTLYVETATSMMTPGPDAPANLSFAYTPGGPIPPAQIFSVGTLGDTMPYAAVTTTRWLSVSPESGTVPAGLTVSVDPTGLAPGTYTGTVLVTSAGTEGPFATALVTLTVVDTSAPGVLGVFPGTLKFNYNVNDGTLPPAQSVLVMSGGVPLDYKVSTGDAKWLSASASGTAPAVFNVSVNPRVGVGMHIGNLTITSGEQTQTIPVTFIKTAGDRDLIQVMFDVGSGPEGLAANLNTHNLFITSSNAAAEAAEAGGATVPEVELPGPPEPALVFHINPLDKTLVSQIVMHGEAEYIGVNSTTGLAYQASQATGELAVIDGSTNTVITYIDLTLDGVPQSPYQVAIDEAQNFIYVGTKSPEPEPYALMGPPYGCKAIRELPSDEVPAGQLPEFDCWHPGSVIVIDGKTNKIVGSFLAGDDPEGVVFAKATGKVYASNEDDGNITVAQGAKRNSNGTITPARVLGTIIKGVRVPGWWQPTTCDLNNDCGAKETLQVWLWPQVSACHGIDDEAEEADKMAVDPAGNVYIIDDRYRVAKINGATDAVVEVIAIPGYDCAATVPDDSPVVFHNTANNIAFMPIGQGKLYVTSEQNTLALIQWQKKGKRTLTTLTTLSLPDAAELDAITTDPGLNQVYITDENLASMWILKGACANGTGNTCVP